jgi:hypothetical protein
LATAVAAAPGLEETMMRALKVGLALGAAYGLLRLTGVPHVVALVVTVLLFWRFSRRSAPSHEAPQIVINVEVDDLVRKMAVTALDVRHRMN